MNLLHLKYAVEVERCGSISKAAESLFMGQPNLSRAIKDLEETVGITIFYRTSKGVAPTREGEGFLNYAKSILDQVEEMESLYRHGGSDRIAFNISIPRASYITHAFVQFVKKLDKTKDIEMNYKETNAMRAIKNIIQGDYNLGIIRFQSVFEAYFSKLLGEKGLSSELLWEFRYSALMSKNSPLANKSEVTYTDLANGIEIAHGDPYVPFMPMAEIKKAELSEQVNKRIFVYERGSQFDLLSELPETFMWVSPIPAAHLQRFGLVQKACPEANRLYRDVLIYKKTYHLNAIDQQFLAELKRAQSEVLAVRQTSAQ